MGDDPNIAHDRFPKQGPFLGRRVAVCFDYDTNNQVRGTVVREDAEDPGKMIIALDDGRYVLSTECQYSFPRDGDADNDHKVVVALASTFDGTPLVILGMPAGAWDYAKDGRTHNFDLSSVGIPVQLVLFGGANRENVISLMDLVSRNLSGEPIANKPVGDEPMADLGIKKPTVQ